MSGINYESPSVPALSGFNRSEKRRPEQPPPTLSSGSRRQQTTPCDAKFGRKWRRKGEKKKKKKKPTKRLVVRKQYDVAAVEGCSRLGSNLKCQGQHWLLRAQRVPHLRCKDGPRQGRAWRPIKAAAKVDGVAGWEPHTTPFHSGRRAEGSKLLETAGSGGAAHAGGRVPKRARHQAEILLAVLARARGPLFRHLLDSLQARPPRDTTSRHATSRPGSCLGGAGCPGRHSGGSCDVRARASRGACKAVQNAPSSAFLQDGKDS